MRCKRLVEELCVQMGLFVSPRGCIQAGSCLSPCFPGFFSPSRSLKLLQFREQSPTKFYSNKTCMNKKLSGSQELRGLCSWDQRPWSAAFKKSKIKLTHHSWIEFPKVLISSHHSCCLVLCVAICLLLTFNVFLPTLCFCGLFFFPC